MSAEVSGTATSASACTDVVAWRATAIQCALTPGGDVTEERHSATGASDSSKPDLTAQTLAAVVAGAVGRPGVPIGPFIGTAAYPVLERTTANAVAEIRAARWQRAVASIAAATEVAQAS